jgi:iron complex outermembrane receptor protein
MREILMVNAVNLRLSRHIRTILRGTTAALAVSWAANAVAADTGSDALDEVTVTAERRTENSKDVPISLTVFNAQAIEQQNFQGVDSYFSQTPNVSFISTGTRDRKQLSLRGVSDLLSPDNNIKQGSFGFYIDEFSVGAGTSNPEIVDIDRIEILRGPQGTYYGRNSVGGAINITTKQPTNDFFGEAGVQYSSFNTIDTHVILNLPLIDNVLAMRIVGRDETSDGNIKNINPIGGGNDSKYKYGKVIIRFTPNERLTVDLEGTVTKEDVGMREGVPSGVLANFSKNSLYAGPPFNGVAIPDGVGFYPNNTNEVNFNRPQDDGTTVNYVSNRVKYAADSFTVTNVLGYLNSNEFEMGDIDGSSLDLFYEHESIRRSALSEELRVQSVPGGIIDWTGGLFIGHDIGHTDQHTFAGADNPFALPGGTEVTSSRSDSSDETYALFGEGVYHIDPKTAFTLGGRFTRERVANDSFDTSGAAVYDFADGARYFSNFSPRATLSYVLTDETNLYGTISRGFKAGGVQASTGGTSTYKPETLWNYEVGAKSELFDKKLQLNASVFYMKWKDIQTEYAIAQSTNDGTGVVFTQGTGNAAAATSYGFETDATALVLPELTVSAGAGYDRAKFTKYDKALDDAGAPADLSGATMPNAPKWTLHADSQYTHKFDSDFQGFARLEWFYKGGIKPDLNSEFHTGYPWDVPAYNVWNLRLGVERATWSVTAFAENLLDKKYYTNAYEKAFVGGMYLEPSVRNYGVKLVVRTK